METLTRVNVFNLDNPGPPPAQGVDSMHAEFAIANEPRHNYLSHLEAPCGESRGSKRQTVPPAHFFTLM